MKLFEKDECTKAGWKRQCALVKRIDNLKEGNLLWKIVYWNGQNREIQRYKIKKVKKENLVLVYYQFTIKKQEILNKEYYLNLEEALKNQIKLQKNIVEENEYGLKWAIKELNYLKNRLEKCQLDKQKGTDGGNNA